MTVAGPIEVRQGSNPDVNLIVRGEQLLGQVHVEGRPMLSLHAAEVIAKELNLVADAEPWETEI